MPSFFVNYREAGSLCGEIVTARDEETARQLWADTHEDGQIENIRRVC
jgi:hypothetical protein